MVRYWMSDITSYGGKFKTVEKNINVFDFSVNLVGWRIGGKKKIKKNEYIVL